MNLHEHEQHLTAYLLGDLTPPEAEAVRRHLAGCAGCRDEARLLGQSLGVLRDTLREDARVPDRLTPERLAAVLATRPATESARRGKPGWLFRRHRMSPLFATLTGLAATLVILAGLLFPAVSSSRRSADRIGAAHRSKTAFELSEVDATDDLLARSDATDMPFSGQVDGVQALASAEMSLGDIAPARELAPADPFAPAPEARRMSAASARPASAAPSASLPPPAPAAAPAPARPSDRAS